MAKLLPEVARRLRHVRRRRESASRYSFERAREMRARHPYPGTSSREAKRSGWQCRPGVLAGRPACSDRRCAAASARRSARARIAVEKRKDAPPRTAKAESMRGSRLAGKAPLWTHIHTVYRWIDEARDIPSNEARVSGPRGLATHQRILEAMQRWPARSGSLARAFSALRFRSQGQLLRLESRQD